MKKGITAFIFFINLILLNSLSFSGIEKWITDFPKESSTLLNYSITDCKVEETGIMLQLKKASATIRVTIIKQTSYEDIVRKLGIIENNLFNETKLVSEKWNINIRKADIDFGLKDDAMITLKIDAFRFKLNNKTILELKDKLITDPVFNFNSAAGTFKYSLNFKNIEEKTVNRDFFIGWPDIVNSLIKWFQNGVNSNNQEILALIYETKVISIMEKEEDKKVILSKSERSSNWFGFNFDYLVPNLICGEPDGIYCNPFSYNIFQPMFNFSFRQVGKKEWLTKPFQFDIFFGGFFEVNASFYIRKSKGDFEGYTNRHGSFIVAGGASFGFGFSAMVPRIVHEKYKGDLFGVGVEIITNINFPYFTKDYYYEYFLAQFFNFVVHVLPGYRTKLDIMAGFNISFVNSLYDENNGKLFMNKFGFTIGARFRVDIFNFFKSLNMYK